MSKEAMKLALEALKQIDEAMPFPVAKLAQAALREALAEQPAQDEPVAWISTGPARMIHWTSDIPAYGDDWIPLYTSPPAQRKPLTDEEIDSFREANSEGRGAGWRFNFKGFARAIEAKLKEKNT